MVLKSKYSQILLYRGFYDIVYSHAILTKVCRYLFNLTTAVPQYHNIQGRVVEVYQCLIIRHRFSALINIWSTCFIHISCLVFCSMSTNTNFYSKVMFTVRPETIPYYYQRRCFIVISCPTGSYFYSKPKNHTL